MVKALPSNAGGLGSIPGRGVNIPHASRPKNQNRRQKQYCNKFNKDFKNGPHTKKILKKKKKKERSLWETAFCFKLLTHGPLLTFCSSGVINSCAVGRGTQRSLCRTEDTPHTSAGGGEKGGLVTQQVKQRIAMRPRNFMKTLRPQTVENRCSNQNLYTNVHSSPIHNSPKEETPQI